MLEFLNWTPIKVASAVGYVLVIPFTLTVSKFPNAEVLSALSALVGVLLGGSVIAEWHRGRDAKD